MAYDSPSQPAADLVLLTQNKQLFHFYHGVFQKGISTLSMNIQGPEQRQYLQQPVRGPCYMWVLHFKENTRRETRRCEEGQNSSMMRSLETIPEITKGIRTFKSGERRIQREIQLTSPNVLCTTWWKRNQICSL